jgi:hypothetical protein
MSTRAPIAYCGRTVAAPRYYANDHARDELDIAPVEMSIGNARQLPAALDESGFTRVTHASAVRDFADRASVDALHRPEIVALVAALTRADLVVVGSPGIRRFSERSPLSGQLDNSRPARFAHVDVSDATAEQFAARAVPTGRKLRRFAHYNVWRALSTPPQDVPLALCDARSVAAGDLITATAVFDAPGQPEWSFEGLLLTYAPQHRWYFFPDLTREDAIVFKTHDSEPGLAHCVPHVAFDDPGCPPCVPPRESIEMRAIALWFA